MGEKIVEKNDIEQAITDNYYSELKIPDQRQVNSFKQYQKIVHYGFHMPELNNILEIGTGFSTVLFAYLARCRQCKVYSIDISTDNFWENVADTRFYDVVKENISFLEGSIISKNVFDSFYDGKPRADLGGVGFESIKNNLYRTVNYEFGSRKWNKLKDVLNVTDINDINEIFFSQEGLVFPEKILKIFSQEGDEFDYFKKVDEEKGLLSKLVSEVEYFDLIFFDSGEFSSHLEWIILKNYIRKGGIAVFHDIYFPKSIKNFLVCAAIYSDPEWQIIYQDETTPQGLLIAVRR